MSEKREIKITAAKGRPMLTWVGKRPLRHVTAFPAQHIETFAPVETTAVASPETWKDWPASYPHGGLLFHGDNKEVLAHLLANGFRGKVKLIYIDPPFDSGADYVRKVQLRGGAATAKIEGESYALGEQIQYTDIWANDNYLQFMYERLMLLKELLAEGGSIWLHCDWRKSHMLRLLLEECFGGDSLQNEIIWQRTASRNDAKSFGHVHDTLLYCIKNYGSHTWNPQFIQHSKEYLERYYTQVDKDGKRFATDNLTAPGVRNGSSGQPWRGHDPASEGLHWKYKTEKLDELDAEGRIYWSKSGSGFPRLKRFMDELEGKALSTIWNDIFPVNSQAGERGDYPTQKPEALLERVIRASSVPGDIILDCFIGSGTTVAVSQRLGRRWIGCDINKGAIQTTAKRLQAIIGEQVKERKKPKQESLFPTGEASLPPQPSPARGEGDKAPPPLTGGGWGVGEAPPAQLSFGVWRVNDYDLKIQRNEAIKLACEHIGVERIAADSYFDGKLGQKLVKIIPFEHPLSPLDLEELRREFEARPETENTIVFVCLGIELAARTWIEDWNRLRKGKETVNKVEVIELRTDAKYGNFIKHEPATAKVSITRAEDKIKVVIEDFISPTILKRLDMDLPLFKAKITDWRSQVDCVMIDTSYDGQVFNVALTDVPERKNDLIEGRYTVAAPNGKSTVAVKIVDMLGEEVLVAEEI